MRLSLVIDGDGKGGEQAAQSVKRAIEEMGKAASDTSAKVEEAFAKAANPSAAPKPDAANDNLKAVASGAFDIVEKLVGKLASGNEQMSKLTGGIFNMVRTAASAAGPAALIAGGFQLAEIAVGALYKTIATGEAQAQSRITEHARLMGVVRDAYSDAAKKAGEFLRQSREVTLLQEQLNQIGLQGDYKRQSQQVETSVSPAFGRNQLPGAVSPGDLATSEQTQAYQKAIDDFAASAAKGSPDVLAFRDALASIGSAALQSNPEVAKFIGTVLQASQEAADTANRLKESEAKLAVLNGTATKAQEELLGIKRNTAASSNEYDRMVKSLGRQTAAMEAEAAAVGKSAGEAARLRAEYLLLEAAQQAGIKVTDQHKQKIAELADQFGRVTQRAAELRLKSDIGFERGQIGRDDIEATVADKLRGVYGDDFAAQMDGSTAASIRLNEQLKIAKSSATEFASSFSRDLASGTGILDALNNALGRLQARLLDMIINQVVSKAFGGLIGGGAGGGGLLSALFGGGSGAGTTGALTMTAHTGAWAEGGYTGDMDRRAIAGVVHGKEFVINAWATAKHRPLLEAINDNAYPGYAAGGYVGPPPSPRSSAGSNSGGGGSNVVEFHLHEAPGVTTREERSQTADGRERVDIYQTMEDVAVRAIGSGAADKPMRGRMGVSPMPVKR